MLVNSKVTPQLNATITQPLHTLHQSFLGDARR